MGKITEYTLFRISLPAYNDVLIRFLSLLKTKKHIVFIYKDNLIGRFNCFDNVDWQIRDTLVQDDLRPIPPFLYNNGVEELNEHFFSHVRIKINSIVENLNIQAYEKRIDIEIAGQNFIENITDGLLFKIYIPNNRIWSNEFERFITLFRDYASNIAGEEFQITQNKTDSGVICLLFSKNNNISESDINTIFNDFSKFIDLCVSNPHRAEEIINKISTNDQ